MKLFMFYVGGDCGGSNVELHDVRFAIGETAEDCYPELRRQWWGDAKSLHLDCWGHVAWADGHAITLERGGGAPDTADKLFFVNLGGYDAKSFVELHRNVLLVASDVKAATAKAMRLIEGWALPHKDNAFAVDKAIDVSSQATREGYALVLTESDNDIPFTFTCDYVPIA